MRISLRSIFTGCALSIALPSSIADCSIIYDQENEVRNPLLTVARSDIGSIDNNDGDSPTLVFITNNFASGIGQLAVGNNLCTASLISESIAITAAHCVYEQDVSNITLNLSHQDLEDRFSSNVVDSWIHPFFSENINPTLISSAMIPYDIALIRLETPAPDIFTHYTVKTVNERFFFGDAYGYAANYSGLISQDGLSIANTDGYSISDFDAAKGVSGGPVFKTNTNGIVAINSAMNFDNQESLHTPIFPGIFTTSDLMEDASLMDVYRVAVNKDSVLNVRDGESINSTIINQLPNETCVIVDNQYITGWPQIRLNPSASPMEAFVSMDYLEPVGQLSGHEILEQCPYIVNSRYPIP